MALRLLAATRRTTLRPALLEEAALILQRCGDRFELALALTDLGRAHHVLGDSVRARTAERRVGFLIGEPPGAEGRDAAPEAASATDLSDAELRVAELAARGMTNRQISERLYVTVSTVEQHLTRVYRKLGVNRRSELPARLTTVTVS